jgi:SAM-dependent methyltransferase
VSQAAAPASQSEPLAAAPPPRAAVELYGASLGAGGSLVLRDDAGGTRALPLDTWLGAAGAVDERVLDRARGPVLDVGCGPGRHVHALARRGVLAVGVDVSPVAVALARRRGVSVLEASIFDRLPGAGRWQPDESAGPRFGEPGWRAGAWRTALLLDGNIGIGGRPDALLRRLVGLLSAGGIVLVELDPPGAGVARSRLRLEAGATVSDWFAWAHVGAEAIAMPARAAGMRIAARWHDQGRWFAALEAP